MALLVTDPRDQERLIAERRASGGDRFDEVWEGTYVMAPLANDEHQEMQARLVHYFQIAAPDAKVRGGVNVSDRIEDWSQNYRCPDVAVFLPDTKAKNYDSFWLGGPDVVVEIVSAHDRTREKIEFYFAVGVRELLIIDRDPWSLELYHPAGGQLARTGRIVPGDTSVLSSRLLSLAFQFAGPVRGRPRIEVVQHHTSQKWPL